MIKAGEKLKPYSIQHTSHLCICVCDSRVKWQSREKNPSGWFSSGVNKFILKIAIKHVYIYPQKAALYYVALVNKVNYVTPCAIWLLSHFPHQMIIIIIIMRSIYTLLHI